MSRCWRMCCSSSMCRNYWRMCCSMWWYCTNKDHINVQLLQHALILLGSYTCKCNDGYLGNGKMCTDIDECVKSPCDSDSTVCESLTGSFQCKCKSGFIKKNSDDHTCIDIDECTTKDLALKHACADNSKCTNTFGDYTCACDDGYQGDAKSHVSASMNVLIHQI